MMFDLNEIEIRTASAADTWQVRQIVLRPNLSIETAKFVEDSMPSATHVIAIHNGMTLGVASIYCQPEPGFTDEGDVWRLRGMATLGNARSKGVGSMVLERVFDEVKRSSGRVLWCNARTAAMPFYERHGFKSFGEEFEIPGAGPHYIMKKSMYC